MGEVVSVRSEGAVAVVTIDSPPVNALSQPVRQGLLNAFQQLAADESVGAVLITCAGRTFVAGADLKEFDTGETAPKYHDLFAVIETFDRPVVAALFGTTMGAGVEIALACHFRCAVADAKLGLPEITLGIIPGAGGTQRLPRLIGAKAALDLILSAAPIDGVEARELGIVDEIISGDLTQGAIAYAKQLVRSGARPRRTADRAVDVTGFDDAYIKSALAGATKKWRGQQAPQRAVDAIRISTQHCVVDGVRLEKKIAIEAENSVESQALRHLFFAEREVARIPGQPDGVKAKEINSAGVVGAGTMGRGISICFADSGIPVRLIDMSPDAVLRGLEAIRKTYESSVAKGRLTNEQMAQRLARIQGDTDMNAIAGVDLVVEAAFESMAVKKELFRQFDAICHAGAVLATNTSTLDINVIAATTRRPESVIGLHFFSPANVMRLLEIVRGAKTSPDVLATAVALARKLRKIGVVVGVCYGFVGNRMMLEGYVREADQLLLEGATPQQLDRVVEGFGFAMGPCTMNDMGGNDIALKAREMPGVRAGKPRPYHEVIDALARANLLGQKTGSGFYRYEAGNRTPLHNPVTADVIAKLAQELGIKRRQLTDEEIEVRCVYPLINEGARILEEGIACRPGDIDVIWTTGYGFPRFRGGPMFYADTVGVKNVYERIRDLHQQHGHYWKPAPLLERLAKEGRGFGVGK